MKGTASLIFALQSKDNCRSQARLRQSSSDVIVQRILLQRQTEILIWIGDFGYENWENLDDSCEMIVSFPSVMNHSVMIYIPLFFHLGWGSLKHSSLISSSRKILILQKYLLGSLNYFHIWRPSQQLSCVLTMAKNLKIVEWINWLSDPTPKTKQPGL